MGAPLVTSVSVRLVPVMPLTGSLKVTATPAVLGTALPVGDRVTTNGGVRSVATPQRASATALTPLAGATWEAALTVAVTRSRYLPAGAHEPDVSLPSQFATRVPAPCAPRLFESTTAPAALSTSSLTASAAAGSE